MKRISDPSQLPEWFNIEPYAEWQDIDPKKIYPDLKRVEPPIEETDKLYLNARNACLSLLEKFNILYQLEHSRSIKDNDNTPLFDKTFTNRLISILKKNSLHPFSGLHGMLSLIEQKKDTENTLEHPLPIDIPGLGKVALSGKGDWIIPHQGKALKPLSLYDVMQWMDKNKALMKYLNDSAEEIANKNNLSLSMVKNEIYRQFMVTNEYGSPAYVIHPCPTVKSALSEIEKLFLEDDYNIPDGGKESDVFKLFEYRVTAYADLSIWAMLEGYSITNKCMANALFPDGSFTEYHFAPSRTIGKFLHRLHHGYMDSLCDKSAEMGILRKSQ